jgi:hypothetical protein
VQEGLADRVGGIRIDRKRIQWIVITLLVVVAAATVTYFTVLGSPESLEPGPRSTAHEGIDCLRCHEDYSGVQNDLCLECHEDVEELPWHTETRDGDDCTVCHYEHVGSDFITDLTELGPHPERPIELSGVHTPLRCTECHFVANVTGECSFCHERYIGETHEVGFATECDLCHIQSVWDVEYDHEHETAECIDCHGDDPDHLYDGYLNWSTTCDDCHAVDKWLLPEFDHEEVGEPCSLCHPSSLDLNHSGQSETCSVCHDIEAWTPQFVNHDLIESPCETCHGNDTPTEHLSERERAPLECDACHIAGTSWAREINHSAQPQPCVQCHSPQADVHDKTYAEDCQWCHVTDRRDIFQPHPDQTEECTDCHLSEHLGGDPLLSTDARHADQCADCHVANETWDVIEVDHVTLGQDCYSCHEPTHADIGGWEVSCGECHATEYWVPVVVDHDALGEDCLACHVTSHPNGKDQFSETCDLCHDTEDWAAVTWDHELRNETGIDCVNCHDDIHRGSYGLICEDCHVTDTWETDVINP